MCILCCAIYCVKICYNIQRGMNYSAKLVIRKKRNKNYLLMLVEIYSLLIKRSQVMKNLNLIIGNKLKDIRSKRNLSLDEVTKLTGVSKAMLGQIERGQSNPTVSTLWKIATGLKVSFSLFIDEDQEDLKVICQNDISPIIEDNNRMKLYPIFPFDANKGFEVFTIELEPGSNHISIPHNDGVEEYIIVTEGQIEITIDNKKFILEKGNSIKFMANRPHTYKNISTDKSIFQNIILYFK